MEIRFRQFTPLSPLKGYIENIWAFESSGPLPGDDLKLIVPKGRLLLTVAFRNGVTGLMNGILYTAPVYRIVLVGVSNHPTVVDALERDAPTGSIGFEFSPIGAYRFFHLKLKEIIDKLYHLTDLLGKPAADLEQRIANAPDVSDKVQILQQFLSALFMEKEKDPLFEFCVHQIKATKGAISISRLERVTGYSSRWLNMKFEEKLGISPKNLASITRFHNCYQALLADPVGFFRQKELYHYYYDESHFIREFKRFAGITPYELARSKNEFAAMFFHEG
jgi:AraC-like DNA-binding protein